MHAAGATKCLNPKDFYHINTNGTKRLIRALIALKMPLKKFVFISSLSVFGAIHEEMPYEDIKETDTPHPNTEYGKSKREAEIWMEESLELRMDEVFPYVILRPTGVYGPRERDYFLMAKSIKQHSDFAVGYKQQDRSCKKFKDT